MGEVTVRELRNHGASVLERVAAGELLTVTRDGHAVAELRAVTRKPLHASTIVDHWRRLPLVDADKLRADIDEVMDSAL